MCKFNEEEQLRNHLTNEKIDASNIKLRYLLEDNQIRFTEKGVTVEFKIDYIHTENKDLKLLERILKEKLKNIFALIRGLKS